MIDRVDAEAREAHRAVFARDLIVLDAAMGTRLLAEGLRLDRDDPCL